jgi:hypothetical protein
MKEKDLQLLREVSLLIDLAYLHWYEATGEARNLKSAEGTIRLEFGNFWYRKNNPATPPDAPAIENVVVYSSVFSARRIVYADPREDLRQIAQGWYEQAKERKEQMLAEKEQSFGDTEPELP